MGGRGGKVVQGGGLRDDSNSPHVTKMPSSPPPHTPLFFKEHRLTSIQMGCKLSASGPGWHGEKQNLECARQTTEQVSLMAEWRCAASPLTVCVCRECPAACVFPSSLHR